jgi:hypothetical protein
MGEIISKFPKQDFLDLIASGKTEQQALDALKFPRPTYIQLLIKSAEFKEMVEDAKRTRADVWFGEIIKSAQDTTVTKEDVPVEKLKFEQRKYLAAIDNPEKYAERSKNSLEISMNIFQEMKDLPTSEARRILKSADPFAQIEIPDAEFTTLPTEPETSDPSATPSDTPSDVNPDEASKFSAEDVDLDIFS